MEEKGRGNSRDNLTLIFEIPKRRRRTDTFPSMYKKTIHPGEATKCSRIWAHNGIANHESSEHQITISASVISELPHAWFGMGLKYSSNLSSFYSLHTFTRIYIWPKQRHVGRVVFCKPTSCQNLNENMILDCLGINVLTGLS